MSIRGSLFASVTLSVFLFSTSISAQTLIEGPGGHLYGLSPTYGSWSDAENYAVSLGGHLVTIDDAAENEWVRTTFLSGSSLSEWFWLGFHCPVGDYLDAANWTWISGSTSTYSNWRPGQPDWGYGSDTFCFINYLGGANGGWDNAPEWFRAMRGIIEFDSAGVWIDLGHALAGTNGEPVLVGNSTLIGGEPYTIELTNALPNATTNLVIGLTAINTPLKGGVLVPSIDLLLAGLPTDGTGSLVVGGQVPIGLPSGTTVYFQHWIADAGGSQGYAASNAISATTP